MKTEEYAVIASGDIHMSNKLPYAKPVRNDMTDRLIDQLKFWEQFHASAVHYKVNAELVLGDLYDKAMVDPVTLTHTTEALVKAPVPAFILPGNHDANSVRGGRFAVEALGAMERDNVKCFTSPEPYSPPEAPWLTFWPIPYMTIGETKEVLREARKARHARGTPVNVLLFHNSITGCKHIGWTCDDGLEADEVCKSWTWVLSGHFHETQKFGSTGKGMYLGAPMHHHFGDAGRSAGYWLFKFRKDGTRAAKFIETRAPRFYKLTSLGDELAVADGDYLRYEIEATSAEWASIAPDARAIVESLRAKGVRASYKHKPVYHHTERIPVKKGERSAALGIDAMISKYVDSTGVVTDGLDLVRLKNLGREILAEARSV